MVEGWLLDVNKIKAYTLEQLTREICDVDNLEEKPKVVLVEEYGGSKLLSLVVYLQNTNNRNQTSISSGGYGTEDIPINIEKDDLYIVCSTIR